ncbi:MAG TPA: SH3 domain-containing protein [Verrucomicrobiales bacterium]|nr:SH3 domain-containing protein [Verrucomicrobiales bacterium]
MKSLLTVAAIVCAVSIGGIASSAPVEVEPSPLGTLRVVEDPDGHTNLRSGPSLKDDVVGKVASGTVVAVVEIKGDWAELEYGPDKTRFIHTSRLRKLGKWKQTAAPAPVEGKPAVAKNGSFHAQVQSAPFVAADHKLKKDKEGGMTVDGHAVHGTDGEAPRKTLSLTVTIDGKALTIPAEATRDLYEPNMETLKLLTAPKPAETTVVVMENSDGAGAYCVAWSFTNGSYAGRVVFGQN